MASFASGKGSICTRLFHPFLELTLVRISVATGAVKIPPVVDHRRLGMELCRFFMAIGARNRRVPTRERKVRLPVLAERERRRLVSFKSVTAITRIQVWRSRELSGMAIAMTVGAALVLYLE